MKYSSSLSAFSGDRWMGVVFHLYRVFVFMSVAADISFMLEPGRLIAMSNKDSSSAKVVYFRIDFTSHRTSASAGKTFTFFLPEHQNNVFLFLIIAAKKHPDKSGCWLPAQN